MRILALCLALLLSAPSLSFAQPASEGATSPADARELFRRGEAAYSAGNYDLAIREWTNAYKIDPRPRIQFNLSQAYERLGDLEKAMNALKSFLDAGDPDDPMYSDANARLSALRQRMALTGVVINGGAEGGQILVDDKDWGRTPRPDKINVAPGSHTVIVRWPGRPEFRTSVVVPAGQVAEVNLPADDGSAPAASPTPSAGPSNVVQVDTGDAGGMSPIVWYAAGGGLAAVGATMLVVGVMSGSAASECGGDTYCDAGQEDTANTWKTIGLVTGIAGLVGGAGLITVGILKSRNEDSATASTKCGVGLMSAQCSVRF